jgi:hypothetical protein
VSGHDTHGNPDTANVKRLVICSDDKDVVSCVMNHFIWKLRPSRLAPCSNMPDVQLGWQRWQTVAQWAEIAHKGPGTLGTACTKKFM